MIEQSIQRYGVGELLLLPFLFRFELLLPFIGDTPAVFWLPLLLVTTPTFAGTLLAFTLLRFAFVSTTPLLLALLLFVLLVLHASARLTATVAQIRVTVRFIHFLPP